MDMELKQILDFHADDFGISKNSCNNIIELLSIGVLNSISVLPNMSTFEYAVDKLKSFKSSFKDIKFQVTIHLNFMEGHCCAPINQVKDLVDSNGYFKINWGTLFLWNYNPIMFRKIKNQLKVEIIAQTKKCIQFGIVSKTELRFDGHQHTHMIPIVFYALLEATNELKIEGCKTTFIRNTQDPILPYYKAAFHSNWSLIHSFKIINLIKCLILNHFSHKLRHLFYKEHLPLYYLCGVFFSGNMDYERLQKILNYFCRKPIAQNRHVEILFHPGSVLQSEITAEFIKSDFNTFHLSQGRKIEYNSIIKLNN